MKSCEELESKILDRVAGTSSSPEDAAQVDAHLAGCPDCRTWLSSCEEAVSLAALPPLSPREEQALEELPGLARMAFRAQRRRARRWWAAAGVALAAAASVAVAVMVPGPRPAEGDGAWAAEGTEVAEGIPAADLSAWALTDPLEEELSSSLEDEDAVLLDDEDDAVTEE